MEKKYEISIESNTLLLVNIATGAEGGRFYSQLEAIKTILEMAIEKHVHVDHAIDLFNRVLLSEIVFQKIKSKKSNNIIKERISGVFKTDLTRAFLEQIKIGRSSDEAFFWISNGFEKHGIIYLEEGRSITVTNKKQGLEILDDFYEKNIVNLIERENIQKQIEESSLPNIDPEIIKNLN